MPGLRSIITVLCIWLTFPALAESYRAPSAVERLATADLRVALIGYRLQTNNIPRCKAQMPATGLLLHSLAQYPQSFRGQAMARWPFPAAVSIESVIPDSPAAHAGLRSGDGLLAIGDQTLPLGLAPGEPTTGLRDRAEDLLNTLPPSAPISITIRREDRTLALAMLPVPACRSKIEVAPGLKIAARSDGRTIQLGLAFVERIDDDGLAVSIAHELAHTILEHRKQLERLEGAGRRSKDLARQFEDEADLLSLDLLRSAGWDPAIAPRFMRSQGKHYDPAMAGSGKHRSAEDRAKRMEHKIRSGGSALCRAEPHHAANRSKLCIVPRDAA
ncbi:MAG: PDZ domain-containing protein [Novosphingobium sp.]